MKNISRRVFIKGLAVAGVAAAASTVLAGCNTNMIPGVDDTDEPEVDAPVDSKVMTFVSPFDDKKTLTLTFGGLVQPNNDWKDDDKGKAKIKVTLDNQLGASAAFNATAASNVNDLYFVVKAYADDNPAVDVLAATANTLGAAKYKLAQLSSSNSVDLEDLDDVSATKVTVEVTMYQALTTDLKGKYELKKQSITYTL